MFKGTSAGNNGSGQYNPKMGLMSTNIAAVNPSHEWLKENVSQNFPEPNYNERENAGKLTKPLTFWMQNKEHNVLTPMTISIGLYPNQTQSGNVQFINEKGQFKYAKTIEECQQKYPDFNPLRPAFEGEFELATLIQRIILYKPSSQDANYLADAVTAGIDVETLYTKGTKGFDKFLEEYKRPIGQVLSVKEVKKLDNNGNEKTVFIQTIIVKPEAFFSLYGGVIDKYHYNRLKDLIDEKQKSGYPLSNDFYTIEPTVFDTNNVEESKKLTVNGVPNTPETNNNWKF